MAVRIVEAPPSGEGKLTALGQEIRRLQEDGRSILYVSVERPAETVLEGLTRVGVDPEHLFILDAVSGIGGTRVSPDPDHIMFVAGPDLLEMMALRAEKIIRSKAEGPAHIVIDSVDTFALYNSEEALREIVHYVINRLERGVGLDFVTSPGSRAGPGLLSYLGEYADETLQLS